MNWKRRLLKVLGSFVTGYGAGLSAIFTDSAFKQESIDIGFLFGIPLIAGLIVALPQLGKVINEIANME